MGYTTSAKLWYGQESWQWFYHYQPEGISADLPGYAYIPGGGWALRDPFGLVNPAAGEPIFRFGFNKPASPSYKGAQVFMVNVASVNHNASTLVPTFAWVAVRHYMIGDVVQVFTEDSLGTLRIPVGKTAYVCKASHDSLTATNKPGSGGSWATYWDAVDGKLNSRNGKGAVYWTQEALAYVIDDIVYGGTYTEDLETAITSLAIDDATNAVVRTTGSFITDGFLAGDVVVLSGFSGLGGEYTVTSVAALSLVITEDLGADQVAAGSRRVTALNGRSIPGTGRVYRCLSAHSSDAAKQPGNGANTADYWVELQSNEMGAPRIPDGGECTAAFGVQSVIDMQIFNQFVRSNAADYNLIADKLANGGSSAGGHNAALSAFAPPLEYSGKDEGFAGTPDRGRASSVPNALVLGITPVRLNKYITTSGTSQGQMLGFLASVFGDDNIRTFAGWDAVPVEVKRAMSPYWNLDKVGISMPTYLSYPGDDKSVDETETYINSPDPHTALEGWALFEKLYDVVTNGGCARTDCIYVEKVPGEPEFRRYTKWNSGGGTLGNHYTIIANDQEVLGEDQAAWLLTTLA